MKLVTLSGIRSPDELIYSAIKSDFLSYTFFAFTCFRIPEGLSVWMHVLRWVGGLTLIAFNLWVKTEAHHVVKDYGWYWGDCFFERGALVFDGVFEMGTEIGLELGAEGAAAYVRQPQAPWNVAARHGHP